MRSTTGVQGLGFSRVSLEFNLDPPATVPLSITLNPKLGFRVQGLGYHNVPETSSINYHHNSSGAGALSGSWKVRRPKTHCYDGSRV